MMNNEKGQALLLVLVALTIGSLVITPFIGHASSNLIGSRIYGEAAFEVLAKAQELERQGKTILHFEIGEPDMETPENIASAGIKAIKEYIAKK